VKLNRSVDVTDMGLSLAKSVSSDDHLVQLEFTSDDVLDGNLKLGSNGTLMRASILPAGHNPTGAFWFDDSSGNFITSSYYMKDLPSWVKDFNAKKVPSNLVANGRNTLLPIAEYTESTADNSSWEGLLGSAKTPTFPYQNLRKIDVQSGLNSLPNPHEHALYSMSPDLRSKSSDFQGNRNNFSQNQKSQSTSKVLLKLHSSFLT
jgi:hypothetical protein